LETLDKSPILRELVSQGSDEGPYIMHPELTKIDGDHFRSVWHFLVTDEYLPALVSNPRGDNVLPKQLDGLVSGDDYRKEAIRAGHLYVIAKRLGMASLEDLIYRKITQAQYQQYGIKCQLDLAKILFSRPEEGVLYVHRAKFTRDGRKIHTDDNNMNNDNQSRDDTHDPLEEWLIQSLKDKFQPMLINHAALFFQIANHGLCAKRGFGKRVFKRKVEDWDALQDNAMAIEDDD
jgi:hypothetical protein